MLLVNICCEIATVLFNMLSFVFNNHLKGKYRKKIKKKRDFWFLFLFFFSCNFLLIETWNEENLSELIHTGFTSRPHKSISTRTGVGRQTSSSMLTRRLTLRCKSETGGKKLQFRRYILCGYQHSTDYFFPHPILLIQWVIWLRKALQDSSRHHISNTALMSSCIKSAREWF